MKIIIYDRNRDKEFNARIKKALDQLDEKNSYIVLKKKEDLRYLANEILPDIIITSEDYLNNTTKWKPQNNFYPKVSLLVLLVLILGSLYIFYEYDRVVGIDDSDKITTIYEPFIKNDTIDSRAIYTESATPVPEIEMVEVKGDTTIIGMSGYLSDTGVIMSISLFNDDIIVLEDFEIGKYEITQDQWLSVMGMNPSKKLGVGNNYPVHSTNWYSMLVFCNKLSEMKEYEPCYIINGSKNTNDWGSIPEKMSLEWDNVICDWASNGYRLPTIAEWLFAARGGLESKGYNYSGSNNSKDVSWHEYNSNHPQEVGMKKPNELGIYDMSGNIGEFCWDKEDISMIDFIFDRPKDLPDTGFFRYLLGGDFTMFPNAGRVDFYDFGSNSVRPDINYGFCGLRLVRSDEKIDSNFEIMENPYKNNSLVKGYELPQGVEMVFVQGGDFKMHKYSGIEDVPIPISVRLSDFYISKYEITQRIYKSVIGKNPADQYGVNYENPVYNITIFEAAKFCNELSRREGLDMCYNITRIKVDCNFNANGYRLPTEAEWEFAAKGGNTSQSYKYSGSNNAGDVAWYSFNSTKRTNLVGQKKANELGIHDMSGNVWELCWDYSGRNTIINQNQYILNPTGPDYSGSDRNIMRGGGWGSNEENVSIYSRDFKGIDRSPYVGFRIVRSVSEQNKYNMVFD
jgi:formylglycine-generating enzyme required for sulfatase activity